VLPIDHAAAPATRAIKRVRVDVIRIW